MQHLLTKLYCTKVSRGLNRYVSTMSVSRQLRSSLQEASDIFGKPLRVLKQKRVTAVGIDRELTVWDLCGKHHRIDGGKQLVTIAIGY